MTTTTKKLISCDHCTKDVEVAQMLTSINPYGVRVICENCCDNVFRNWTLYSLRSMYAWEEFDW